MITVEYDPSRVVRALDRLAAEWGVSVQRASYQTMANYTEEIGDKATPPWTQRQGKRQIAGELSELFAGMSKPFAEWIQDEELFTDKRIKGTRWNLSGNVQRMATWHQRHRGARGKVKFQRRWTGQIAHIGFTNQMYVPKTALVAYRKEIQSHVGRLKKGWLRAIDHWSQKAGLGGVDSYWMSWVRKVKTRTPAGSHSGEIGRRGDGDLVSVNDVAYAGEGFDERRAVRIQSKMQRRLIDSAEQLTDRNTQRFNKAA